MQMAPDLNRSGATESVVLYPGDECLPLAPSHRQVHTILIRRIPQQYGVVKESDLDARPRIALAGRAPYHCSCSSTIHYVP
jgi:hypothetical protein